MANILIIEDNVDDLQTIKVILEKNKHKTNSAKNGKDAINLISNKHFDVILIDIFLPDVSGYKLLEIIREKVGNNSKYIYITIIPKREIKGSKFDGFIQKPFLPDELIREVNKCIT